MSAPGRRKYTGAKCRRQGATGIKSGLFSPDTFYNPCHHVWRRLHQCVRHLPVTAGIQRYRLPHFTREHAHDQVDEWQRIPAKFFPGNRVDNNNTFSGLANWNYGLHYNFPITSNFKLLAGGLIDLNGGFVYNLRNGNNPAQARAYINLDASGMAIWDLRIKNYPISLRYQVNLPFAGVMFCPNYGQSYYEIFTLGNWGGVINFTSLHNQPSLRQMLTVDFPVGRAKMRLAYLWDAQQAKVNDIRMHTYSHVFMVGFVKELFLIRDKKRK